MNFNQIIESIYIHIPFCLQKCHYCVFPVHFLGNSSDPSPLITSYLASLSKEMNLYFQQYSLNFPKKPLKTLYFGGGTPSIISPEALNSLINLIKNYYTMDNSTEISIEMNPGTFDKEKVSNYRGLGFNRFSLGVQSFDTNMLNLLNRGHSLEKLVEAIEILSPLENVSWDLLMNLPYEKDTKEFLLRSLPYIERFKPGHLSVYSLILEPESIFSRKFGFKEEIFPMPSQDFSADQYEFIDLKLRDLGYSHYEISSFAKNEKFFCRHNEVYWEGDQPFWGFGMGASSLFNGLRITRPKTIKKYMNYVENLYGNMNEEMCGAVVEKEQGLDGIEVILMGGLRREKGVDLRRFGEKVQIILKEFEENNGDLVEIKEGYWFRVKGVRGFLICDEILTRIFLELER